MNHAVLARFAAAIALGSIALCGCDTDTPTSLDGPGTGVAEQMKAPVATELQKSKGGPSKGSFGTHKGGSKVVVNRADSQKTHVAATKTMNAVWAKMSAAEKKKLTNDMVKVVLAFEYKGPAPWGPSAPPADPKPATPCKDCGKIQKLPGDPCGDIRDRLEKVRDEIDVLEVLRGVLTEIQQKKAKIGFYAGVADALANVVSAGITLATAGGGALLTAAAKKILKDVAKDQLKDWMTDLVADALPPPLDSAVKGELDDAAIDALLGAIKTKLMPLYNEKNKLNGELSKCVAKYNQQLASIKTANDAVLKCRNDNPTYCP